VTAAIEGSDLRRRSGEIGGSEIRRIRPEAIGGSEVRHQNGVIGGSGGRNLDRRI